MNIRTKCMQKRLKMFLDLKMEIFLYACSCIMHLLNEMRKIDNI